MQGYVLEDSYGKPDGDLFRAHLVVPPKAIADRAARTTPQNLGRTPPVARARMQERIDFTIPAAVTDAALARRYHAEAI